jgi:phage/plasmid-associated DNA primase
MYEKEGNFIPVMKLVFLLNDLPAWKTVDGQPPYHIVRRNAYLLLKKRFLDPDREEDKQFIEKCKVEGKEYLYQEQDNRYYENHIMKNANAFLRFIVQGAVTYYQKDQYIRIPKSMQRQALAETSNKNDAIEEFVHERLRPATGKKSLLMP